MTDNLDERTSIISYKSIWSGVGSGIATIFFLQVSVNALVVSGSIPPTGLPLPLISCGNTSLIVFMGAFGVVYNISKNTDKLTL